MLWNECIDVSSALYVSKNEEHNKKMCKVIDQARRSLVPIESDRQDQLGTLTEKHDDEKRFKFPIPLNEI